MVSWTISSFTYLPTYLPEFCLSKDVIVGISRACGDRSPVSTAPPSVFVGKILHEGVAPMETTGGLRPLLVIRWYTLDMTSTSCNALAVSNGGG